MPQFLAETRISAALIGMLHAIPTTPLYERLKEAGRLNDDDAANRYGTNVIPLGISPEDLRPASSRSCRNAIGPTRISSGLMANLLN
jgi:hypothetical protein